MNILSKIGELVMKFIDMFAKPIEISNAEMQESIDFMNDSIELAKKHEQEENK